MSEFDIYCQTKSGEDRAKLTPVRDAILHAAPAVSESRVHFYLVYHLGPITVVKLDLGPGGKPRLSFVNGSELDDPDGLLKGKGMVRTISIPSENWLEDHHAAITDLVAQSFRIMQSRWDGTGALRGLSPDQPSP